jgi:uracil-DNA glycosylase
MSHIHSWKYLNFWRSPEWKKIQGALDDMDQRGIKYWPKQVDMFRVLDLVPSTGVRVLIVGQDPYPNEKLATGVAFSIPDSTPVLNCPPTLFNILRELQQDLEMKITSGSLEKWCKQGVFLWNVYPIYDRLGRMKTDKWHGLTEEIVQECNRPGNVLVFLGAVAQQFAPLPNLNYDTFGRTDAVVLKYSHNPFRGSRMFSTINSHLKPPIDWSL